MPISAALVGVTSDAQARRWSSKDALLYALSVGAGQLDPLQELEFTTENSHEIPQRVLPTFANIALGAGFPPLPSDLDLSKMLHAEQSFVLEDELPPDGQVTSRSSIISVHDKRSGALITAETTAENALGQRIATINTAVFFRGYGNFGGDPGQSEAWDLPVGKPDFEVTYNIPADQALLYRLTGDRHPLHSDPAFAQRSGFTRPILHGMCTYGYTGRALLHSVGGSDPRRFRAMSGRFTKTIFPGQSITVSIWIDGANVRFRTVDDSGAVVIDRGTALIN